MIEPLLPASTVFEWFGSFREGCVFKLNFSLVAIDHKRVGREALPSAAILGSQSVKAIESS